MLKFFRKYNKIILVVGACFLMVAFLIQPVLSIFTPDPLSRPVGTVGQSELTVRDKRQAQAEVRVLGQLPIVGLLVRNTVGGDSSDSALHWMLLLQDAHRLGLSASQQEVSAAVSMLGLTDQQMQRMAKAVSAGSDFVRQCLRHWLIIEQYRSIVGTQAFDIPEKTGGMMNISSPGLLRLRKANSIMRTISQQSDNPRMRRQLLARASALFGMVMQGSQRLSSPVIRAYLQDNRGQLSGQQLTITARSRRDRVDEPTKQELQSLFDQYKGVLSGQSEPYGFGYRLPDRVKLEYLRVPMQAAMAQVSVDDRDGYEFYDQNKSRFVAQPSQGAGSSQGQGQSEGDDGESSAQAKPYKAVRDQILSQLKQRKARELVQKVVHSAEGRLKDAERSLPDAGQYKEIPDDYQALSLKKLAKQLQARFGVQVEYQDHTADWVQVNELSSLPGIGRSMLGKGQNRKPFAQYVQSARGLEPGQDNRLTAYRLQIGMASRPMHGFDGASYLFRLTAAQAEHTPDSLNAVRGEVVRDAKLRAAYKHLRDKQRQLRDRVIKQGFSELAQSMDAQVQAFGPISRRSTGMRGGISVPYVQGIGRSKDFVDTVFERANQLANEGEVESKPVSKRLVSVALDKKLSLVLARIDSYQPLTRNAYESAANQSFTAAQISRQLARAETGATTGPLSLEAVKQRTGFVSANPPEGDSQQNAGDGQTGQARPIIP